MEVYDVVVRIVAGHSVGCGSGGAEMVAVGGGSVSPPADCPFLVNGASIFMCSLVSVRGY